MDEFRNANEKFSFCKQNEHQLHKENIFSLWQKNEIKTEQDENKWSLDIQDTKLILKTTGR